MPAATNTATETATYSDDELCFDQTSANDAAPVLSAFSSLNPLGKTQSRVARGLPRAARQGRAMPR